MFKKNLWIVLLFSIIPYAMFEKVSKGVCSCSVMRKCDLNPILENNLQINVSCNEEGINTCQQLCIALADSARERAPDLICEKLNSTVTDLYVELYSKICDESEWKSSGLKNIESICCKHGKAILCPLIFPSEEDN